MAHSVMEYLEKLFCHPFILPLEQTFLIMNLLFSTFYNLGRLGAYQITKVWFLLMFFIHSFPLNLSLSSPNSLIASRRSQISHSTLLGNSSSNIIKLHHLQFVFYKNIVRISAMSNEDLLASSSQ